MYKNIFNINDLMKTNQNQMKKENEKKNDFVTF